jgi:hypothetical protein
VNESRIFSFFGVSAQSLQGLVVHSFLHCSSGGLSCFTGTCARQGAGVCNFLASGVDSNKTALYISPPVVGA